MGPVAVFIAVLASTTAEVVAVAADAWRACASSASADALLDTPTASSYAADP
jgi:hypothetical protein